MVRFHKKKTAKLSWTDRQIQLAMQTVVEEEKSCKRAAAELNVQQSTLSKKVHMHISDKSLRNEENSSNVVGFTRSFTHEQEETLAKYITDMESKFVGLTGKDVRKIAFDFAEKLGIPHKFNKKQGLAGIDWLRSFMSRYKLSDRKAEHTSAARIHGFNQESVSHLFDLLKQVSDKYNFSSDRIYNVDETGFSAMPKNSPKIIAKSIND